MAARFQEEFVQPNNLIAWWGVSALTPGAPPTLDVPCFDISYLRCLTNTSASELRPRRPG